VPREISQLLDRPPVSVLINAGADPVNIVACLAAEIARCANMLTVGGNLRQGQSIEIAKELIGEFPNESLEDFCYCLRAGIKGAYGEIFRFDMMVIVGWFRGYGNEGDEDFKPGYLHEKYELKVRLLMEEKDNFYTPIEKKTDLRNPEIHQQWLNKLKEAVGSSIVKRVPDLSEQEKKHEGKEKPKAAKPWNNGLTAADEHNRMILRRAAGEFYKGRTTFKLASKPFVIEGFEIMAESESDAIAIYTLATKGV
jgi:hypothetical protein